MSKENLEQFMNQIAESEELQAKIGEEIDAEALIALGAECGCEFTAEELSEAAQWSDWEYEKVYRSHHTEIIFSESHKNWSTRQYIKTNPIRCGGG